MVSVRGALEIPEALNSVLPAEVTKVEQYFGSFVRLNCISAGGGLFEVRVYLADWVFLSHGATFADSAGTSAINNAKLSALNGEKLRQVAVGSERELWLMFTGDMALKLIANLDEYEPDDELLIASLADAFWKFSPTKGFVAAPHVRIQH